MIYIEMSNQINEELLEWSYTGIVDMIPLALESHCMCFSVCLSDMWNSTTCELVTFGGTFNQLKLCKTCLNVPNAEYCAV